MRIAFFIPTLMLLLFASGCKDPYYPELKPGQTDLLVVEGFISPGDSATRIRLSRTLFINDSVRLKVEAGAQVSVEGEDNAYFPLVELAGGEYVAPQLALDFSKKYRLRIITRAGGEYASEYVALKQTPPLTVGWSRSPEGVQVTFSSQDPQDNTRYYKWNYEETWEINSRYPAMYKFQNGEMDLRDLNEQERMRICWSRTRPTNIRLVTTVPLAKDVINQEPVVFIPTNDERLDVRYSVLVRLQALDKRGFEFFQMMKKTTESLGSLFDPQPSEVGGNVRSLTNPQEKVIGYVSASVPQEARLFIDDSEVPNWAFTPGCQLMDVSNHPDSLLRFKDDMMIPYATDDPIRPTLYHGVDTWCGDCRTRGNNLRPSFW